MNGLGEIVLQMVGESVVVLKEKPHAGEGTLGVIEKFYFYLT